MQEEDLSKYKRTAYQLLASSFIIGTCIGVLATWFIMR